MYEVVAEIDGKEKVVGIYFDKEIAFEKAIVYEEREGVPTEVYLVY